MELVNAHWLRASLSALLVAAAMAGCGGGDNDGGSATGATSRSDTTGGPSDTTVTTSSRTKTEFIQLANGICKRANANRLSKVSTYLKTHGAKGSPTETDVIDAYRVIVLSKIPAQIERIRALGAPEGDAQQIEAFLASLQDAVDAPPQSMVKALYRSGRLAHAYKLDDCSYP